MTSYFLTTQGMRVVETDDKGNVKYRREYGKGDKVDVSHMDEARVETLVESGDLTTTDPRRTSEVDTSEQVYRAAGITGPVGAEGRDAAGNPVAPTGEPGVPAPGQEVRDDFPTYTDRPRPDGWSDFSDEEKRAYIYGPVTADTGADTHDVPEEPGASGATDPASASPETVDGVQVEPVDEYSDMDYAALQKAAKAANLNAGGTAEDLRARLREDDAS